MRKIEALYKVTGSLLTQLDMESVTPAQVFTYNTGISQSLNTKYMATVNDLDTEENVFVDLSLMGVLTELINDAQIKLAECDENWKPGDKLPPITDLTWDIIGECITDKLVMGYCNSLPEWADVTRSLRYFQVIHHEDFELSYCMLKTPEDRNVKWRRWQLPDAAITKINENNPIDLNNCLLSVNGCLSLPFMFKGELIMPRGAEFINNNTFDKLPSVTLLDFTNLGGIRCVPFSDCKYKTRTGKGVVTAQNFNTPVTPGQEIEIFLPEDIDIKNKTIWMVLGHTLYFDEFIHPATDKTLVINPYMLALNNALLKSGYHSYKYFEDNNVFHADFALAEYINQIAWEKDHFGAFFVIINTPRLYIRRVHAKQYAKERMHVAVPDTVGLLWDDLSRSVVDHTRVPYRTYTDFYGMPLDKYSRCTVHDFTDMHVGAENIHPWYQRWLDNNETNMFVMEIIRA